MFVTSSLRERKRRSNPVLALRRYGLFASLAMPVATTSALDFGKYFARDAKAVDQPHAA